MSSQLVHAELFKNIRASKSEPAGFKQFPLFMKILQLGRYTFRKWLTFTNFKERYKMLLRFALSEPISRKGQNICNTILDTLQSRQTGTFDHHCTVHDIWRTYVYLPTDGTQEEIHYEKSANQNKRNKIQPWPSIANGIVHLRGYNKSKQKSKISQVSMR